MTRSIQEVFAEIESWGPNIAEELAKRGIKGRVGCPEKCPMAVYILTQTDPTDVAELTVEGYGTFFGPNLYDMQYISNPDNMTEFIEHFDDGAYWSLDVRSDEEDREPEPDQEIDPDQYPLW